MQRWGYKINTYPIHKDVMKLLISAKVISEKSIGLSIFPLYFLIFILFSIVFCPIFYLLVCHFISVSVTLLLEKIIFLKIMLMLHYIESEFLPTVLLWDFISSLTLKSDCHWLQWSDRFQPSWYLHLLPTCLISALRPRRKTGLSPKRTVYLKSEVKT